MMKSIYRHSRLGRKDCLKTIFYSFSGQRFAMMEEKVILAQILRKFQVTALDKKEDIKLMTELILRPKDNLRIVFKPRQN